LRYKEVIVVSFISMLSENYIVYQVEIQSSRWMITLLFGNLLKCSRK